MSANDGGPVYPVTGFMADASGALCGQTVTSTGLSILDHFAGLSMLAHRSAESGFNSLPEIVAAWAYNDAAAMLAERAKRLQPSDLTDLPFGGAK